MSKGALPFKIVANEGCPPDRVYVFGAPAKVKSVRFGESRIEGDAIVTPVEIEYQYEPVKMAVIHLGEESGK